MEDNYDARWFAVQLRSRHEFQVFEKLTGAGIETFLPTVEKLRKWKDRNKLVRFPLFSGYLFVHIDLNHQSRLTVLKTKGVVRLLGVASGEPVAVPDEQVLSLKQAVDLHLPLDPYPYLREGTRVRITRGPLNGVEGILVQKTERHYLVLSIDILQRSTAVTIEATDVEVI